MTANIGDGWKPIENHNNSAAFILCMELQIIFAIITYLFTEQCTAKSP